MMRVRAKFVGALAAISAVGSVAVAVPPPLAALVAEGPPTVVISEIMYNPVDDPDDGDGPDIDNFEYIELHNPGTVAVSLAGMVWLDGVDGALPEIDLNPGEYVIVSPDSAAALAEYDVTAIGNYEKKLSNDGETLILGFSDETVVDKVTYAIDKSWPAAPNGTGSSLELIDPTAPGRDAVHWQASVPGGTPGSGPVALIEAIDGISVEPTVVEPNTSATIRATITGFTEAELVYRVGFEAEQRIAMEADGTSYSASIPGQESGALVRYRIETGLEGPSSPDELATYRYHGFVVSSQTPDTDVPRIQLFIADDVYAQLMGPDARFDRDTLFDAVVAYDDEVYDGSMIQIRGGDWARTNYPKQSFNVEMPEGRLFDAPALFDYPVDEFAMQGEYADGTNGRAHASWYLFEKEGFDRVSSHFAYVERNGDFFGVFRIGEKLDGVWRDAHGWGDNNFYKAAGGWDNENGFEQKEGDEDDPILETVRSIIDGPSGDRAADLYDTFDVPNIINYVALTLLIDHNDQRSHNFYVGHDVVDTGRVSLHPWDLDWTWKRGILTCNGFDLTEPTCINDAVMDAFWAIPDFQAAVYRRIRTILDTTVASGILQERHRELIASVGGDAWALELREWGGRDPQGQISTFDSGIANRVELFSNLPAVPSSQADEVPVVISEIHYKPADDGPEHLELANPSNTTVDLSGWRIDGVKLDIPFGTVIPPLGRIVFTDDDRAFRAAHPGLEVIVIEYPGGLSSKGEEIALIDSNDRTVDVVLYSPSDPWPTEPLDGIFPLELTDLGSDNTKAESWAASTVAGGTPGRDANNEKPTAPTVRVVLRARGSTGTEIIELQQGRTALQVFELSDGFELYSAEVPVGFANKLRVAFVNNAFVDAGDRNVYVDYLEVDGERVQAEGSAIPSVGHYADGTCGFGFKRTEKLHCNGYFDFTDQFDLSVVPPVTEPPVTPPTTPPSTIGSTIIVDAAGEAGGEQIELFVDGESVASMRLTADPNFDRSSVSYEQLVYNHPTKLDKPEIRVAFINDSRTGDADRNVRVDAVTLDGARFEAEGPAVVGTGVWRNDGRCQPGTWSSEFLHCNGSLTFPSGSPTTPPVTPPATPPTTPPTTPPVDPPTAGEKTITVYAAGQAGGEVIELRINEKVVATKTLTAAPNFKRSSVAYEELTYTYAGEFISVLEVAFTNDSRKDGMDLNVRIDAVTVDDERIESETSFGTGVWNNGGRCQPGVWASEFLHCNGKFSYID